MPYKAIKTDDRVKVVEWEGPEPENKYHDGKLSAVWMIWRNHRDSLPKYPTLPSDKWELDRVYRDDEVWIVTDTVPDKSGNPQQVRYAMIRFPGGSPVINIPAVPNIQEDEDKVWAEAFDIMTGHYEAGTHGWIDEVKQKFNLTIKK